MTLRWYGVELKDKIVREMYKRTNRAVMLIEKVAKKSMRRGGRTESGFAEFEFFLTKKDEVRQRSVRSRIGAFRSQPGEPPRTQTGTLRRSITHEVFPKADQIISTFAIPEFVGRVGTNIFYGKFLEFGTGPRTVRGSFMDRSVSRTKIAYEYKHPGMKPRPWLRPAFHRSQRAIAAIFRRPIERL